MDDPRRFLPLTPQQFHILLALTDGHLHGYAIIRDVSERTGGRSASARYTLHRARQARRSRS
jgi:DNA-binding PadR family transcriptional regulator